VSETQKYGHVTYFWNGNKSEKFSEELETFKEISSDKVSFDERPWMKSAEIADDLIEAIKSEQYDFIRCNFPNGDMVGHTGNMEAAVKACMAIDICLGKMIECAEENFYKVVIVGSHGNADTIIDRDNNIITQNTLSPVPFVIMDKKIKLRNGKITDFAPTILKYMDIAIPKEMKKEEILIEK
jgi:2,3-bisphosphoglycerate-independent phosphoglycerate mutase